MTSDTLSEPIELIPDEDHFNDALQAIRSFEIKQLNYIWNTYKICNERRIGVKIYKDETCK